MLAMAAIDGPPGLAEMGDPGVSRATLAPARNGCTGRFRGIVPNPRRVSCGPRLPRRAPTLYPLVTPRGDLSAREARRRSVPGSCRERFDQLPTPEGIVPAAGQGGFVVQEADREAHLSAKRPSARQAPRVPAPDVGSRRTGGAEKSSAQGPPPTVSLIWRVRDRQTMLELRRSGTRVRSGAVTVTHLAPPAPTDEPPRLAFAIGRRIGPAVVRNRVRRRLRSILRELANDPAQMPRGAYLFSVRPAAVTSTYAQLQHDVHLSLAKIVSSDVRAPVGDGATLVG